MQIIEFEITLFVLDRDFPPKKSVHHVCAALGYETLEWVAEMACAPLPARRSITPKFGAKQVKC